MKMFLLILSPYISMTVLVLVLVFVVCVVNFIRKHNKQEIIEDTGNVTVDTKKCPLCGEQIAFEAKKCRYCSEWVEKKCPYCGENVAFAAKMCRYCGEWFDKKPDVENLNTDTKEEKNN